MGIATSAHGPARTILVAGDVTVDWNIARARPHLGTSTAYQYVWGSDLATRACSQRGGAALLTDLLGEVCRPQAAVSDVTILGPPISDEALSAPSSQAYTRSYSVWSPHPQRLGGNRMVWRASEFWGTDRAAARRSEAWLAETPQEPLGIVLDDANLGFRDRPDSWPQAVSRPSAKTSWVIAKVAHPVGAGPLWEQLVSHFADRLTVVVSVGDLRKANLQIGYALSWEQLAAEIVDAVTHDEQLSKPATVVVALGTTGAVVIDRKGGNKLVFDPHAHEEDWRRERPGVCVGYSTCVVAALVAQMLAAPTAPDWPEAVRRGIHAARTLHESGYAEGDGGTVVDLKFPLGPVVEALRAASAPLASIELSDLAPGWTILSRRHVESIENLAAEVVRSGPETVLSKAPVERIGAWASADRAEIEQLRSLRNIMAEYVAQARPARPLSVAVFGPPGSGKSFAVKEIARALSPGRLSAVEFNLSQFESADELVAAMHRVRDAALLQQIPLVFWDEFDTPLAGRELGWLRYFLAPMQDGEFREEGVTHPLGPAIFVFAGGVHATMENFQKAANASPASKGRDFVSRLRGYLNVLGPNRHSDDDRGWPLRRALLFRSLLKRKASQLFDRNGKAVLDEGVLRAFLETREYRHGARSMESIIDMSSLAGKLRFERSCLPAAHQLEIHVDAVEFLRLVAGNDSPRKR